MCVCLLKNPYAKTGAVSEREGKQANATAEQQMAAVAAARKRVEASRAAVTTAKANLANPNIRRTQTAALKQQIAEQKAKVQSAEAAKLGQ
jgi:hypothetical protein